MTPPLGFRFSAVSAGIRKDGRIDLALAVADEPAVAAGVFTRNLVRAAPVEVAARRVAAGTARAVLVNAGCANACTGAAGEEATLASTAAVARALGVPADSVLPASTGVIGALLPTDKIAAQAPALVGALSVDGWDAFSRAILTTDRGPKVARAALPGGASVLGVAKGAGMIHPDLGPPQATMLAFLFTDARVEGAVLQGVLGLAVADTFNAASVDGDTSTNDTVIALASGKSGACPAEAELVAAFTQICAELARAMVADGEGASHVAEIVVTGLPDDDAARVVARTVATSLLVKTALFGNDANWGRLLAAAGRAGVRFDPRRARIWVGDVEIVKGGVAVGAEAEGRAAGILAGPSYTIGIELGDGPGRARYLTSDLGHSYVDVNAGYRS
ncbi:MAG: bifunctional glutamate N-acetyltransferase/amino-acid acetyltransferase ArgJ [Polyangiaceae bacterium]|nr:bifunctional glutamate N-acetyltransferase/amino-acid acetyltransferase ArgJ [Polyangiaceae bacterium]